MIEYDVHDGKAEEIVVDGKRSWRRAIRTHFSLEHEDARPRASHGAGEVARHLLS
jgi:hypothetical protein